MFKLSSSFRFWLISDEALLSDWNRIRNEIEHELNLSLSFILLRKPMCKWKSLKYNCQIAWKNRRSRLKWYLHFTVKNDLLVDENKRRGNNWIWFGLVLISIGCGSERFEPCVWVWNSKKSFFFFLIRVYGYVSLWN